MPLTRWAGEIRQDLTFALRQLRRAPGFALVAAITLALGIGANSAIFALVDATLLKPLPLPEPDRLVMIWERTDRSSRAAVSPMNLIDWNERSRSFELIAGFAPGVGGMVMNGADGTAETVPRQWTAAGIFEVLGVKPIVGRLDRPSDEGTNVVILGEAFWRTRFNADPGIVGRDIRLDGDPFRVIGVVPSEAELIGKSSIWAVRWIPRRPQFRGVHLLGTIGRLKPGVSIDAARADLAAVAAGLAREFPATNSGRSVSVEPLQEALVGRELRITAMLFLGVVGFVLLICCANVANLLLARATVRTRELAIRSALGAERQRLLRQLLTESLLLAAIGGALGVALGAAILNAAPSLIPAGLLPGSVALTFDARVVAFCLVAALFVGILFGLAPAWQAAGVSSAQVIASSGRTATGRGGAVRSLLVVGEVATAVLLLVGAGLLLRTLLAVDNVDRGYRADSVLTMLVDPLGARYPTRAALVQFFDQVESEIEAVPGVRAAAWASTLPMGESYAGRQFFEIVGDAPPPESQRPTADYQMVSPRYFEAIDLPIVAGRGFDARDREGSVPVCMVNEAFVRRYVAGRSPVGLRIALRPDASSKPTIREIVGVARQVKERPDEPEDLIQVYVPFAQDPMDDMFLVVRPVAGEAAALAPSIRAAIGRIDKEQLVSVREIMTLDEIARQATSRHRFRAVMVVTFAGLALLLAMVGVFGTLAYSVQQRVRDFGVRRALGATSRDVLRLALGHAARIVAAGAAIGLVSAVLLVRLIDAMLFGVQPLDPVTFAGVVAVLIVTAALAVAAPAWRAISVDPVEALRIE